jgi:D-threonine aldolase
VFVDLNVGMNRTGIPPDENALAFFGELSGMNGIIPIGFHVYDGHIRDADRDLRKAKCDEAFRPVERLAQQLIDSGEEKPVIVAGGSATFSIHAERPDVECSPGTFVFWDYGYRHILPELPFRYAALVITRIVSLPSPDLICTDLGHKSIASENPLSRRVFFLNGNDLEPVSQSEEHLVLKAPVNHSYAAGDILYGVPYHICPTCALYDTMYIIKDHQVKGEWPVEARTRTLTV